MAYAFRAVAPALNKLLAQLNTLAPKRSKLSDGALGDQAHAARVSFHNPNSAGIVLARDFTHDPANGLDCNRLASALVASGDKRIHEIIWNRRYWTPTGGWVPYLGSNPHDKHLHLTVRSDPKLYNSTAPWDLGGGTPSTGNPEDDMYGPEQRDELVVRLDEMRAELDVLVPQVTEMKDGMGRLLDAAGATRAMVANLFARDGVDVDEAALARDLAPLLTANARALSDADVRTLAAAFADEADRRDRDGDPATGTVS